MPIAYLDTPSGISGDIFLGCLLDAGWPIERLRAVVEGLHLPPGSWRVDAQPVMKGPLRATLAAVEVTEGDAHRHLSDVTAIIGAGDLPPVVQQRAIAVFTRLAQAEARVHNTTVEQIHFHEVGALDAIVDIVGVCAGLAELGIERLHASPLPLGHGWAQTQHGRIPLPAPATLELLAAAAAPTVPAPGPGELVTPTGAALLAELADFSQPRMVLRRIGYGAGRKEFDWPNVARLWVGEGVEGGGSQVAGDPRGHAKRHEEEKENPWQSFASVSAVSHSSLVVIETNIDDMNPELYEPVRERLFGAGALDVWTTAIGMKKGRPGTLLSVLAGAEKETEVARLLLRETTTLGVRVYPVARHIAKREFRTVETVYGPVLVKVKVLDGERLGAKPEFDDCKKLADAAGVPVRMVCEAALAAAQMPAIEERTSIEIHG
ncbi:MAG: nickel pincer cofactor biosynthesis protein LarC [Caldilineaceae bacterium]|nr:nickel pincer cofactor biosynthesis protein LarC [Caldilineaceae bacterium]